MKHAQSTASSHDPIWNGSPEPDVWWDKHGIDALIWPKPYATPTSDLIPTDSRERSPRHV
jgi:hypothetical protein